MSNMYPGEPSRGNRREEGANFPMFPDGDVAINLNGSHSYQLHKNVLANGSSVLKELLCDENTVTLSTHRKKKRAVVTNTLRAVSSRDSNGEPHNIFVPVKVNAEGRAIPMTLTNPYPNINAVEAFEEVLGALYHIPIDILGDPGKNLVDVINKINELLEVAGYLECVPIIAPAIEAALLSFDQDLLRSIAGNPAEWLSLSIRIQSKILYRECLVLATGQINTETVQKALLKLDETTREQLIAGANNIKAKVQYATSNMLSYYPVALQRTPDRASGRSQNSRNSYANDILHWMAVTIFRSWLAHAIVTDQTHHSYNLGNTMMRKLKIGANAYLNDADIQQWHTYFPLSARATNVITLHLWEIKKHARTWTNRLFDNFSKLNVNEYQIEYFTCAKFDDVRYPWVKKIDIKGEESDESDDEPDGMDTAFELSIKQEPVLNDKAEAEEDEYDFVETASEPMDLEEQLDDASSDTMSLDSADERDNESTKAETTHLEEANADVSSDTETLFDDEVDAFEMELNALSEHVYEVMGPDVGVVPTTYQQTMPASAALVLDHAGRPFYPRAHSAAHAIGSASLADSQMDLGLRQALSQPPAQKSAILRAFWEGE